MNLGSNGNIYIFVGGMILVYLITLVIPFLIGFVIVYFILVHLFSDKKGKLYIKTKDKRIIISILISIVFGYITFLLLGNLFGDISNSVIKVLSN